jgi:hypothetical protein
MTLRSVAEETSKPDGARELLAPHRTTRGDVLADDRVQDVAGAVGKRLGHGGSTRQA